MAEVLGGGAEKLGEGSVSDRLKGMKKAALVDALGGVEDANVLPADAGLEDVEAAADDSENMSAFEAAALAFFSLVDGKGEGDSDFMASWRDFFSVEDSPEGEDLDEVDLQGVKGSVSEDEEGLTWNDLVVNEAKKVLGSTEFRGKNVDGGNLACAQVVSTILKRAGLMDRVNLSTSGTVRVLENNGWDVHSPDEYVPKPGDVVVWKRTKKRSDDGEVKLGYPHIGVVLNEGEAISNSSRLKTPRVHRMGRSTGDGYWYKRGIAKILSPPK